MSINFRNNNIYTYYLFFSFLLGIIAVSAVENSIGITTDRYESTANSQQDDFITEKTLTEAIESYAETEADNTNFESYAGTTEAAETKGTSETDEIKGTTESDETNFESYAGTETDEIKGMTEADETNFENYAGTEADETNFDFVENGGTTVCFQFNFIVAFILLHLEHSPLCKLMNYLFL